ncbi:MAG: hypothetical protein Q8L48_31895 [Archangium sp.]|nr:hypothetical protein [Archangium sp.]
MVVLLALLTAAPVLSLGAPDERGCARGVRFDGKTLGGGPAGLCIRELVTLRLEEGPLVALRVDAPHRFDGRVRSRVFLYRVAAGRLVPRFLGSGFASREVTGLFALDGALGLETTAGKLRCVFDGFPLVCSELTL